MTAIKDVAKLAGMSVSAVSKYLKAPDTLRPESRERIEVAIRNLHYSPSPIARSLRTKRTGILAVVVPDILNPFFAELFEQIRSCCAGNDLLALLLISSSPDESSRAISSILSRQADGVILCFPDREDMIGQLQKKSPQLPVVMMSWHRSDAAKGNILLNVRKGIKDMTDYLIGLGHTEIGYIGGFPESTVPKEKFMGFCEAFAEAGLKMSQGRIRRGAQTMTFAKESALSLVASERDLQAIVCENDILAVGCVAACMHESILIPYRLSVTGFDDIPLAETFEPQITTMRLPISQMAQAAVEAILQQQEHPDQMMTRVFDAQMIVRGTTVQRS